jgi:hypothetical protein
MSSLNFASSRALLVRQKGQPLLCPYRGKQAHTPLLSSSSTSEGRKNKTKIKHKVEKKLISTRRKKLIFTYYHHSKPWRRRERTFEMKRRFKRFEIALNETFSFELMEENKKIKLMQTKQKEKFLFEER